MTFPWPMQDVFPVGPYVYPFWRTYDDRLREGFTLINAGEDEVLSYEERLAEYALGRTKTPPVKGLF